MNELQASNGVTALSRTPLRSRATNYLIHMANTFKTIGLWGRMSDPEAAKSAAQISAHLRANRIEAYYAVPEGQAVPDDLPHLTESELARRIDMLVVIGGDGTMLRAARAVTGHQVPLLGVNRGRLGFLTDIRPEQMLEAIDAILSGDYIAEQRRMLAARIVGSRQAHMLALNDVVLQQAGTGHVLDFTTTVDGSFVNSHGGDGLIVATPTGSTAYALSCNGPIIQPDVDAVVMVPICPHTLSDRPLVLKATSVIEVQIQSSNDASAHVFCDGEELGVLATADTLIIEPGQDTISLLHPTDYNYYELLRSKLNWGRANRNGQRAPTV